MSAIDIKITIYSKKDCPLCEDMSAIVHKVRGSDRWTIEQIDIENDEALEAEYKEQIPVLFINGRKAFKARVTEAQLKKKIMKAKELTTKQAATPSSSPSLQESFVPPRAFLIPFFAVVVFGFSFFLFEGVLESKKGLRNLTEKLLRVQVRDAPPIPFDLEKMTGGKLTLLDLKDKIVFLNFWATWCPPCVEEMPSIRRLHEKLRDHPQIAMLLVSADESWAPVRKFFGTEGAPFTVLLDPEGEMARKYGTSRFPETYVIIDGKIQAFIEGPRDWDTWFSEAYLTSFLNHP